MPSINRSSNNSSNNNTNIYCSKPHVLKKVKSFDSYFSADNKEPINSDAVNKSTENIFEKSDFSAGTTTLNANSLNVPTSISESESQKNDFDYQVNLSNELDDLFSQLDDFKDRCICFIKNFSGYTLLLYTLRAVAVLYQFLNGCTKEIKSVFSQIIVA